MPTRKALADILEILMDNLATLDDALPYLPVFLNEDPPLSADAGALLSTPEGRNVLLALRRVSGK
jgi:hypothetical protein